MIIQYSKKIKSVVITLLTVVMFLLMLKLTFSLGLQNSVTACSGDDKAASQFLFDKACDAADGSNLELDDNTLDTMTFNANTWAGYDIQSVNTSVTDCNTIDKVEICFEWWQTSTDATVCQIHIDNETGVSRTLVNSTCPGASANPGVVCQDVTGNESWSCENFFGSSGTRANASLTLTRTSGGGPDTLSVDVFYFNVTYSQTPVDNDGPLVDLQAPDNLTTPWTANNTVQFIFNTTDVDSGIYNCSIYTNESGSWQLEESNNSVITEGSNYTIAHQITEGNGIYLWNTRCYDDSPAKNSAFDDSNWTVDLNVPAETNPPLVDLQTPANDTWLSNTSVQFVFNTTDVDSGIYNCSVYTNETGSWILEESNNSVITEGVDYTIVHDIGNSGNYLWNVICYDDSANFNNAFENANWTVTVDLPPNWSDPINDTPTTYNLSIRSLFNVSWNDDNNSISDVFIEANFTGSFVNYSMNLVAGNIYNYSQVLPAGQFQWKSYANDTNNQFNVTDTYNFTISRATSNVTLELNETRGNISILQNENVNHTGEIIDGNTQNISLLRDGTVFYFGASPLINISDYTTAGTFNITVRYNQSQNFTASIETWFVEVNSTTDTDNPLVDLQSPANDTWLSNTSVQFIFNTTDITSGIQNCSVYTNETGSWILEESNNSVITEGNNYTIVHDIGNSGSYLWNVRCYDNSDEKNNASDDANWTVIVDLPPNWSDPINQTPSTYNISIRSLFNVSWNDDNSVDQVFIEANFTGIFVNYSMNLVAGNIYNYSQVLPAGQFQWKSYANDTNNQFNVTDTYNFTISRATSNVTLELNETRGNLTINISNYVNHTGEIIDGDVQNISLLRDGAVFYFGASPLINISDYVTAGTFNITVRYNKSQNFTASNETWFVIVVDEVQPLVDLQSPANDTWSANQSVQFIFNTTDVDSGIYNCSVYTNETGSWILEESNSSVITEGTNYTITHDMPNGVFLWNVQCYDDSSNRNNAFENANWTVIVLDTTPPEFSNIVSFPTCTATYNDSNSFQFNTTWSEPNSSIDQVLFEHNFTGTFQNVSSSGNTTGEFFLDQGNLAAATYNWKSFANNTDGFGNNTMAYQTCVVNRASPSLSLFLNDSQVNISILRTGFVNITGVIDVGDVVNIDLLEDGTPFNSSVSPLENIRQFNTTGTFNITVRYNQSENYTASIKTFFVEVNDTFPNWSNPINDTPSSYDLNTLSYFNVSWSDDLEVNTVFIEANFTGAFVNYSMNLVSGNTLNGIWNYSQVLPAGQFQWRSVANDSNNQLNATDYYNFTIARATSNITLELNETRGNISILQNEFVNHTGETIEGDIQNISLLRDGTVFANGSSPLTDVSSYSTAGTFNITARYNESQNFTASIETWFVEVNESTPPLVDLQSPANDTWSANQSVQFIFNTTDADSGIQNCSVYTNETGSWILEESDSGGIVEGDNYTITHDMPNGVFLWNVQCYDDSSTKNKGFDDANWTVIVLDTTPPEFSNIISFPVCPATYNDSNSFQFNTTWSEPNSTIDQVLFEHNFTGTFQNVSSSGNTTGEFFLNQGNLAAATYNWKSFANNTDGFGNNTMAYQTCVVNRATPSLSLFLNDSQANISILRTGFVNITGVLDVGDSVDIDLLEDGTPFNSSASPLENIRQFNTTGTFNITVRYNQTQNYTTLIKTFFVEVNDTFPNWSDPINQTPSSYDLNTLSYFNVSWSDDLEVNTVFIEANFTGSFVNYSMNLVAGNIYNYSQVLPAGQFQWRSVANDSNNQLNATIYYNFTISRATSNVTLELNETRSNRSILQNDYVNHTGEIIDGDSVNIELLRDGTVFDNGPSPLENVSNYTGGGTFNITIRYNESQNFTGSFETWFIQVNESIPPLVDLQTPANDTWIGNTSVRFVFNTTDVDSGIQNCSLYTNETGSWIVEESNTSIVEETLQTVTHNLNSGSYLWNFRCYDDSPAKNNAFENANWTVIIDLPPFWSNPINDTPSSYGVNTRSLFNITWQEDFGVDQVFIEANFTGTSTNYTMNLISGDTLNGVYNYSQVLPAGTFQWKSYANDSNNEFNVTDVYIFTINRATSNVTLELNETRANFTININEIVNHTGEIIDGDVQNISLLRDGAVFANGSSPLTEVSSYTSFGDFNITVRYNESENFTASIETWFVIVSDDSPPLVDLQAPANTTWLGNTSIQFVFNTTDEELGIYNCSIYTNETGSWILEESNNSVITEGSNHTIVHDIGNSGNYLWNVRCYDDSSNRNNAFDNANWTVTVDLPPNWSDPINQTPSSYDPNTLSYFNVSWQDDISLDDVFIEANFTGTSTNYSMNLITGDIYNYSQVLPAGTFQWKSYANDSNNQFNVTETYIFTINRATSNVTLELNETRGNISILQNGFVNHTGEIIDGDVQNISLLRDGTVFYFGASPLINISDYVTAGTFNITVRYNQSQNFTALTETWYVQVNESTPPLVDLQTPANDTWLSNTSVQFVFNTTDLDSGIYNCSVYTNETGSWILEESNNSVITEGIDYTIVHGVGNSGSYLWNVRCYDNSFLKNNAFDNANWTVTVDLPPNWSDPINDTPSIYNLSIISLFNVSWQDDISLDDVFIEANFTGTFVNYSMNLVAGNIYNYSQVLPAGTFQWKSYANDSNNQFNVTETYIFTINRATSNVTLELNETRANFTININEVVNHTGELIDGDTQNISLLRDGTVFANGSSPLTDVSSYTSVGTFNITVRYNQSQNFTASIETWYVIVQDQNNPLVDLQAPDNLTTVWADNNTPQFVFNTTDVDSGIYNCSVYTNETGSWILEESNNSVITEGDNYTIAHQITAGDGIYLWNVRCYDDSTLRNNVFDNANWTINLTVPIESNPPLVDLQTPANDTWTSGSSIEFVFNVTDVDSGIYNCSVYTNETGNWTLEESNNSVITEGSDYTITHEITVGDGIYLWNVRCYDDSLNFNNAFDDANWTVDLDTSQPPVPPAGGAGGAGGGGGGGHNYSNIPKPEELEDIDKYKGLILDIPLGINKTYTQKEIEIISREIIRWMDRYNDSIIDCTFGLCKLNATQDQLSEVQLELEKYGLFLTFSEILRWGRVYLNEIGFTGVVGLEPSRFFLTLTSLFTLLIVLILIINVSWILYFRRFGKGFSKIDKKIEKFERAKISIDQRTFDKIALGGKVDRYGNVYSFKDYEKVWEIKKETGEEEIDSFEDYEKIWGDD